MTPGRLGHGHPDRLLYVLRTNYFITTHTMNYYYNILDIWCEYTYSAYHRTRSMHCMREVIAPQHPAYHPMTRGHRVSAPQQGQGGE